MSAGYFPKRTTIGLEDLFSGLITASHILHNHAIVDAYGHISVRNPEDPKHTFWMPRNMAPALLSSAADLVQYRIEDAEVVDAKEDGGKEGFIERFIHSEVYKRFPGVNCVVHGHCAEVLPFAVSGVPLKCALHMAGFLGSSVPVWDASGHYASGAKHDLLVRDAALGASLAAAFKPATSAGFIYSKVRSALPQQIGGSSSETQLEPDHAVVLMQNHGFTTVARGIEEAVCQAIYTKEAAKAQTAAILLHDAHFGHVVEGKVDVEAGGKIKSAKVKGEGDVKFLSDKEASDAWEVMQGTTIRPWPLWVREVEVNPLYRNECKLGEE